MPADVATPILPFGPVRNSELFANHWLDRRLPDEPEWTEFRDEARTCLDALAELWKDQAPLVECYGAEATLEKEWIQPVLDILRWHSIYQTWVQGREPDYALCLDIEAKRAAIKAGRRQPQFWEFATVVADAKAWDIRLDKRETVGRREYPPEQIEDYLLKTELNWGLLTNGRLWRLIPSPAKLRREQPRFDTFLEVDLPLLLERWLGREGVQRSRSEAVLDEFMRWYLLATPVAFISIENRLPLIERALTGSTEYRLSVGDQLRSQVFEALQLCIGGFLTYPANGLDPATHLSACRANSFTLLFRLLFVLYAEDRGLLPYRQNALYTRNRALSKQHDELIQHLNTLSSNQTGVWEDWLALFNLIDAGGGRYGVPPYNGGLFDPKGHPFLIKYKLPDPYAANVLDKLRRTPDPKGPEYGVVKVDYRDLAIQHLGNIYEGLLELLPRYADEPMVVVRGRERGRTVEKTVPASKRIPEGFEPTGKKYDANAVYLETRKGERRESGSYYTPDHIVEYIVEKTLGSLCDEIDAELSQEITSLTADHKRARGNRRQALGEKLEKLAGDYDDRVLQLSVLDPAMGSGHFLIRACQYLAEQIATNPHTSDPDEPTGTSDEPTLLFWKRRVAERCLYGVDKNPIAVELAQLALWLETVSTDRPLTFLDHHLRRGDSLIGSEIGMLGRLPDRNVPDAGLFGEGLHDQVPVLLKPLEEIRQTASATVEQVKRKDQLYRTFNRARLPFQLIADVWCSTFFIPSNGSVTPEQYHAALKVIDRPRKFGQLASEEWFEKAIAAVRAPEVDCFHWELEFPEVFLGRDRPGFDAIIGNPPYDVLAEKELGRDLSAFKEFIEHMPVYDPSRRGKNNLYKLFICRALDLLTDGGRLGFIVPMTLLGDLQAAGIRKAILDAGAFTSVDAFPQKDDPRRRVFPEAKLSTVVFTTINTGHAGIRSRAFLSRQHPANIVKADSAGVRLTSDQISLYDSCNRTVVSCSQADWDLAVAISRRNGITKLGDFVTFFQGEVNETNERRNGNLASNAAGGQLVTRGSNICLYVLRQASQGNDIYLRVQRFLAGKRPGSKAFHHQSRRIGLQESSPQNNFRRVISCLIPAGNFSNHKVNYLPDGESELPLEFVLALLNSKLADWYFRLGSTNAAVSHYQLCNLPCPVFAKKRSAGDAAMRQKAIKAIRSRRFDDAFDILRPKLNKPPFCLGVQDVLVDLVKSIIRIEEGRGEITRVQRSALAEQAQPLQDLIDRLLYAMAGLTVGDITGLEERLAKML